MKTRFSFLLGNNSGFLTLYAYYLSLFGGLNWWHWKATCLGVSMSINPPTPPQPHPNKLHFKIVWNILQKYGYMLMFYSFHHNLRSYYSVDFLGLLSMFTCLWMRPMPWHQIRGCILHVISTALRMWERKTRQDSVQQLSSMGCRAIATKWRQVRMQYYFLSLGTVWHTQPRDSLALCLCLTHWFSFSYSDARVLLAPWVRTAG